MPYTKAATLVGVKCQNCPNESIERQIWESSDGAFEDYHYTCKSCGHDWWIDGPDA